MKIYVVDTGALISYWERRHRELQLVTTQAVLDEVRNRSSQRRVETLMSLGRLSVEDVVDVSVVRTVTNAARQTGDLSVLSEADLYLLAVALSRHQTGHDVTLVSTDIAVLNTASFLGIKILDPTSKMRHHVIWKYQCPACGHQENSSPPTLECPVCGTTMRRRAKSRRSIR